MSFGFDFHVLDILSISYRLNDLTGMIYAHLRLCSSEPRWFDNVLLSRHLEAMRFALAASAGEFMAAHSCSYHNLLLSPRCCWKVMFFDTNLDLASKM